VERKTADNYVARGIDHAQEMHMHVSPARPRPRRRPVLSFTLGGN
jgi:hypothetical protein